MTLSGKVRSAELMERLKIVCVVEMVSRDDDLAESHNPCAMVSD